MTESLQTGTINYDMTSGARRAVAIALQKAHTEKVETAPSAHLLEALVESVDPNSNVGQVLRTHSVDLEALKQLPEGECRRISEILYSALGLADHSRYSSGSRKSIISMEHLLMALIAQHDPTANLLNRHGMYVDKVRAVFISLGRPETAPLPVVG
jgi:ATP-dependent Clp protease ATP-binding subunit ClpA